MFKWIFSFILSNSILTSSLVAPTLVVQKLDPKITNEFFQNKAQTNYGTTSKIIYDNKNLTLNYEGVLKSNNQLINKFINPVINSFNNINIQDILLKNSDMKLLSKNVEHNGEILYNRYFNRFAVFTDSNLKRGGTKQSDGTTIIPVGFTSAHNLFPNKASAYENKWANSLGTSFSEGSSIDFTVNFPSYDNGHYYGGDFTSTFYFDLVFPNVNDIEINNSGILNINIKYKNVFYNASNFYKFDGYYFPNHRVWSYCDPSENPSINFIFNYKINLPYNINTITNNIKNRINTTLNYSNQWIENITPIAENLYNDVLNNYVPDYLRDAINLKYNVNLLNNTIDWTYSYELMDGTKVNKIWKTIIKLAERPNLQVIYGLLKQYIETPILLVSNTSSNYKSNSIPLYIKTKFDEAKRLNQNSGLPNVIGSITSKANPNNFGELGGSTEYIQGNYFGDTTDYYLTHNLMSNTEIILNYIRVLMTNFWNTYSNAFVDDPSLTDTLPTGNVVFTNDSNGNPVVRIRFSFDNPPKQTINNQPAPWDFNIPITCQASDYCIAQGISDQLLLQGQNVPIIGPNQEVTYEPLGPDNSGIQIGQPTATDGGIRLFYSQVNLTFNANENQSQTIYVNGNPLPIINNMASTILSAPNEPSSNSQYEGYKSYQIEVKDGGSIVYSITVYIGQTAPKTNIAYYAWDPKNNPAQMDLITPTLTNGQPNPNYNPNINDKTGTTTQILWIEQKSKVPMYIDPYDDKGQNINHSTGFLASGTVINRGVKISFDSQTSDVYRTGVRLANGQLVQSNNPTSLNNSFVQNIGATTKISPNDSFNPYFSYDGIWNYTAKSKFPLQVQNQQKTGIYGQYFVMVNNDVNANTSLFTEQLNKIDNSQLVVKDFWDTYHGDNLVNYLVNKIGYTEEQIKAMDYETILQYWNLYSVEGLDQSYSSNRFSLNQKKLNDLRIKSNDSEYIKNEINSYIEGYLNNNWNLQLGSQYTIEYDPKDIQNLVDAYNQKQKSEMYVYIKSNPLQDYVTGQTRLKVINDPNTINLDEINFGLIKMNNKTTNVEELKSTIIDEVDVTLNNYISNLGYYSKSVVYGVDYSIDWTNINKLLITEEKPSSGYTLYFPIYALETSEILIGNSSVGVKNSTEYDIVKMLNFKDLKIQNLNLNISMNDVGNINQAKAVISNYIFAVINNAFIEYFNKNSEKNEISDKFIFEWNPNIYSNDSIIFPSTFGQTWTIDNYDDILNSLVKNIDQNSFNNTLTISVVAVDSSIYSTGTALFRASNSKLNDSNPEVPNMPDNPTEQTKPKKAEPKWWIIPIVVVGTLLLVVIIWVIWYRIKSRRLTSQS